MVASFQVNLPDATYHYTDTTGNTDVMDINATAITISSLDTLTNPISIADAAGVMSLTSTSLTLAVLGDTNQTITAQADYLEMPNIKPVQIYDNTNSGGTAGQYLGITGDGLTWESPPAPNLTNVLAQSGDAGQQPITNLSSLAVAPAFSGQGCLTIADVATEASLTMASNGISFILSSTTVLDPLLIQAQISETTSTGTELIMPIITPIAISDGTSTGIADAILTASIGDALAWSSTIALHPTNTTEKVAGVTVSDIASSTTSTSITDNGLIFKTDIYQADISANLVGSQMVISTTALKPSILIDDNGSSGTSGQLLQSAVVDGREYLQWVNATDYTPPLALVLDKSTGPYGAGDANYLPITNLSSLNLQDMAAGNSVTMAPVVATGSSGGGATLSLGIAPDTTTRSLSNKYLPLFIGDTMYYLPLYT